MGIGYFGLEGSRLAQLCSQVLEFPIQTRSQNHVRSEGLAAKRKCRFALLLTDDEALKLANAIKQSMAPDRSFIVVESILAGLQTRNQVRVQGRRRRYPLWLPTELKQAVKQLALELHVSQQDLLRHFLRTYLESPPWKRISKPHTRTGQITKPTRGKHDER